MDDELPFASHITKRSRIYQCVRRVPEDLGDAFPFARVQRSLRTFENTPEAILTWYCIWLGQHMRLYGARRPVDENRAGFDR